MSTRSSCGAQLSIAAGALAGWGFYNALGGEPLWNLDVNERLRA